MVMATLWIVIVELIILLVFNFILSKISDKKEKMK